MDPNELTMMKRELVWNCWVAQGGWKRVRRFRRLRRIPGVLEGSTSRSNVEPIIGLSVEAWSDVHAILGATACISRTLWPASRAGGPARARAADLRSVLHLPPLPELETRGVRNAYEHFENAGPKWFSWARGHFPGRPLMGWQLGDGSPLGSGKVLPEECFRYLDVKTWTLRVGQEKPVDLNQLMVAVELLARAINVDHRFEIGQPP